MFKSFTLILVIFRDILMKFTCQKGWFIFSKITEGNNNFKGILLTITHVCICLLNFILLFWNDTKPFQKEVLNLKDECFSTPPSTYSDYLKEKKICFFSIASTRVSEERRESRGMRCLSFLPSMGDFNLWITLGISCNMYELNTLFI